MDRNQAEPINVIWNGQDIIFMILVTLSITISCGFLLNLLLDYLATIYPNLMLYKSILLNLLQFVTMLALSWYIISFKYNLSLKSFGFRLIPLDRILGLGIIGGVLICLIVILTNFGLQRLVEELLNINMPPQSIISKLTNSQNEFVFLTYVLLIVIIAPITEEIFFRGILYQYLKDRLGVINGALLASGIFGIAHLNLWTFLATALGGLGLIIIYEISQSLYTNIIAHATWNLIIVMIIYLVW
ncbi:CPBP family intramembrane glutamic endopeptidase [Selenihalanaerobacter shriftii]|uniref:CAAX prenyl protease 2/Lysostaphin resistance protein A-like domain-containing protein n=1 Tax=Selenihalanaerobacter shriftii TaxID=142842 RepID=A0A1T4JN34_9FIRM|nr:type II CAAX endopeptidase family protein [Selenihalanaerobacter shriftii]SJZ31497.1 hypothetical protein SAMN02745118_00235 [Selenihalanaerobacter shriftii]